ncbi:MAG: SusC/RagA family TonB-linked outer membrane protein [Muribaculaceae bacterium]|nr:SusC/RagA family TonB-linked outer membrane protein [Muribaculaceae bacterium]
MKKLFLLFLTVLSISLCASAQTRTVTGTVYDAQSNEELVGVSVTAGQGYGAVTDIDGHFSISVPSSTKALSFTYVGYKTQDVNIPANGKMSVYLSPSAEMLDEVIAVAYGEQKRSAFTGSAAVVGAATIEKTQSSNVLDALSGRVAGLQLSNASGAPGSGNPSIRIRGFSSVNSGMNDPLIIVDGAPFTGDITTLNNNDIESMTVLKDAASNALYGARGANGVILITTKRAKLGEAQVVVDAKWGANTRATQDYDYITDPGMFYETYYKALYNYASFPEAAGGLGYNSEMANYWANQNMINSTTYGLGYNVFTVPAGQMLIGQNGKINPNATLGNVVSYKGAEYFLTPDSWMDATYKSSLRQEYNISIAQGTEKGNFRASVGYLDNQGIITAKTDYRRFTGRLTADVQAKEWLKVGANVNYTHYSAHAMSGDEGASNSTSNVFAAATEIAPIYPLYMRDANGNIMVDANGLQRFDYGDGANAGLVRPIFPDSNALNAAMLDISDSNGNLFNATGYFEVRFLKDFRFTSNNTVYVNERRSSSVTNPFYGAYAGQNGMVGKSHTRQFNQSYQQLLNWSHQFGKHNAAALAGHEYNLQQGYALSGNKSNMFDPWNTELNNAIIDGSSSSYTTEYNNEGWIFRGLYDYDAKYFGNVSYRRDASSKFHPKHRWGNFWSLGASWILTKEDFMESTRDWLNSLKVKVSYGEQGNDNIGNFLYTNVYSLANVDGYPAAVPETMGNEKISWEKGGNFNAGVEFSMFNNRFSGGVDGFYRKTTDMLMFFSLPSSFGYTGYYRNVGDMMNAGVELELSGIAVQTRDFTWTVNFNMTWYKNRILYLDPETKNGAAYRIEADKMSEGRKFDGYASGNYFYGEGLPMYTYFNQKYAGVDPNTGKALYYMRERYTKEDFENGVITDPDLIGTETNSGKVVTTDVYGNADRFAVGSCLAPVYGGLSTTLEYKGFDLTVNCNYQIGGLVYDSGYARLMGSPYSTGGKGDNIHADILNAWTPDNRTTDIPRYFYSDQSSNSESSRFLTDASYFSIENINFGYTLPGAISRKMYLQKLRFYFACENVWVWSKRQGLDPRQSFTGGNNNTYYAPIRTISGGLSVTF